MRGRIWPCGAPTWQLRCLCAYDRRLRMAFEFHDKYHPISGIEHVIKVWFEVWLSDLYATFWFEGKCSHCKIVHNLRFQLCRLISFEIDTLHNFDEVGGWRLRKNDHFFAYGAITWAEPTIDDHCLAEREKQHLEKQITDNVQFRK